ncbi:MAG: hypothetical protein ACKVQB_02805 [Bacteroidia bacterium]
MKKKFRLSLAFALYFIAAQSYSQTQKGQVVIGAGYGGSALRGVVAALWTNDFIDASVKSVGPIAAGIDYGLADKFSIGVNYATQTVSGTVFNVDWFFIGSSNTNQLEVFDYSMTRTHISIAPKIHYFTNSEKLEKLDLYSGLRVGYIIWDKNFESSDPGFPEKYDASVNGLTNRASFGIIAIGARYYLSENIGVSTELNIGAPYIFSLGAVYKIGGSE